MSDPRIESIAESLGGTPPEIVERSAAARAAAQGISLDDVLASWSGGAALAPAAAPEASAPAAESDPEPAETPAAAPAAETAAPAPAAAAVAVVEAPVIEVEEVEIVEPAPLGDRMKVGARMGALLGGVMGILALVVTVPLMLSRLSLPSGESTPAVEVTPLAALLTIAVLSAAFGAIITTTCRGISRYVSPAYATQGTPRASAMLGAFNGLLLGFVAGGILVAMAEATLSETKLLPVRSLVFTVLIGGVVLGAVTGALAQAMGQPATLQGEDAEAADTVKRRLLDSMAIPLISSAIIGVIVVSLGMLFVQFPTYAPVLAILVAIGIIAFASLMASRPNLRITRGEVLAAAAGLGVILLMIALIASQVGGGHHEEEHSLGVTSTQY